MQIRTATIDDLTAIAQVEAACFPPAEAATADEFKDRLDHYANHFWLMFDNDKLIPYYSKFGFVNEGISESVHGNVTWYQMRLTL